MIFLLSPAKTLDYSETSLQGATPVRFKKEAAELVAILKTREPDELSKMMSINREIAIENANRFRVFKPNTYDRKNAKQAILAFKGHVYHGMKAFEFEEHEMEYAQEHVRILSGLYGLLRPLDLIQPYRLEMGSKLETPAGKDLYAFWGDKITRQLNKDLKAQGDDLVINLASQEYFRAVNPKSLQAKVVHVHFKEYKNDTYKVVSVYAKMARGMMVHFAASKGINTLDEIKGFNYEGYAYHESLSNPENLVFTR